MNGSGPSNRRGYVVTDPKGTLILETGKMLQQNGYKIKIFNTINFKKSMHYNPFAYIHSEKDILKLVTCLIANTKGEGKGGDDFWLKAETLLYTAIIGYIYYKAPPEEQNFATLVEFINAFQIREDDENFKNNVDILFDELEAEDPNHFAVRQYKKFKLRTCFLRPKQRPYETNNFYAVLERQDRLDKEVYQIVNSKKTHKSGTPADRSRNRKGKAAG